jgi:alpha-D-xyloside xylohydrolase
MLDPDRPRGDGRFSTYESADELVVHDDSLAVHVDLSTGRFSYRNGRGELLFAESEQGGKQLEPRQDTGGYRTRLAFTLSNGEALYGLGQHEEGTLDRRGQHLELYQHNLKVTVPFLVSSRGWGLLWHGYSAMTFHDDASGAHLLADCVDEMDYFVCTGDAPNDVIRRYRRLTGPAPIPAVLTPRPSPPSSASARSGASRWAVALYGRTRPVRPPKPLREAQPHPLPKGSPEKWGNSSSHAG